MSEYSIICICICICLTIYIICIRIRTRRGRGINRKWAWFGRKWVGLYRYVILSLKLICIDQKLLYLLFLKTIVFSLRIEIQCFFLITIVKELFTEQVFYKLRTWIFLSAWMNTTHAVGNYYYYTINLLPVYTGNRTVLVLALLSKCHGVYTACWLQLSMV